MAVSKQGGGKRRNSGEPPQHSSVNHRCAAHPKENAYSLIPSLLEQREAKMTNIADIRELKARIIVFGVGGAGGNAVNNMIEAGLQGVDFIVANTDAQALPMSKAQRIIQTGTQATQSPCAGPPPPGGRAAAQEA